MEGRDFSPAYLERLSRTGERMAPVASNMDFPRAETSLVTTAGWKKPRF